MNPVDLGTILVPSDYLLLGPGQAATLDVAAISRKRDVPRAEVKAWFESEPGKCNGVDTASGGDAGSTASRTSRGAVARERDVLSVVLEDGNGHGLWHKTIPVMLVSNPPARPRFGATYERLRYDAPISVRDPKTGTFSSMPYEGAWAPDLKDVVVWLPNGSRFVFWRGSSYIPFWAGRHNTGACYEWAKIISQPAGAVDCVEPLMDKELRYSRVEIIESTAARVHVRWSYQSTDFEYKVWGDAAVEDYYFYQDGFGTRVVNLKADPRNDYELSEFIILTPGAYPLDVLPDDPVDALFLDGRKHTYRFPNPVGDAVRNPKRAAYRRSTGYASTRARNSRPCSSTRTYPCCLPWSSPRSSIRGRWSLRVTGGVTGPWRGGTQPAAIDDRIALTPTAQ